MLRIKSFSKLVAILATVGLFISACGVKGPLYLPKESDSNNATEASKPAEADQEKTEQ